MLLYTRFQQVPYDSAVEVEEEEEEAKEEEKEEGEEEDEEEEVADGGLGSEMQPPTAHQTKGNARTAQQAVPPWAGLAHPRLRPFPLVGGWRLASCSGWEGRALDVLADAAEASGTLCGIVEALPRETYLPLYSLPPPPLPTRHLVWRRWRRKGKQRQTCSSKEGRELEYYAGGGDVEGKEEEFEELKMAAPCNALSERRG